MSQVRSLTLRTFHVGGTASNIASESEMTVVIDGTLEFDEIKTVRRITEDGEKEEVVVGRSGEIKVLILSQRILNTLNVPYGSLLKV